MANLILGSDSIGFEFEGKQFFEEKVDQTIDSVFTNIFHFQWEEKQHCGIVLYEFPEKAHIANTDVKICHAGHRFIGQKGEWIVEDCDTGSNWKWLAKSGTKG